MKKGMERNKIKLYYRIKANPSAIWQQAAHTTYQLSSPGGSTGAIEKSITLNEKCLRIFWRKKKGMTKDH